MISTKIIEINEFILVVDRFGCLVVGEVSSMVSGVVDSRWELDGSKRHESPASSAAFG